MLQPRTPRHQPYAGGDVPLCSLMLKSKRNPYIIQNPNIIVVPFHLPSSQCIPYKLPAPDVAIHPMCKKTIQQKSEGNSCKTSTVGIRTYTPIQATCTQGSANVGAGKFGDFACHGHRQWNLQEGKAPLIRKPGKMTVPGFSPPLGTASAVVYTILLIQPTARLESAQLVERFHPKP